MELFDKEVIFSKSFPKAYEEVIRKAPEIVEGDLKMKMPAKQYFDKLLSDYERKYVYIPRTDAEQRTKEIISYATQLCEDYQIDTEIARTKYSVDVSMNIGFGWFGGHIKRTLDRLITLTDGISTFNRKDDPNALIIVMNYYTHDRYASGE